MKQTATQDPLERWNTCIHEAGHAVMAYLMNKGPHGIAVFDKIREEAMGMTHMKTAYDPGELDPKSDKDFQEAVSSALCIVAGIAADMLSTGHCDGGDLDHDEALETMRLVRPGAKTEDLYPIVVRAQEILAEPENWGKVVLLTHVLFDRGELSGTKARELLKDCRLQQDPPRKPVKVRIVSKG